MKVFELIKSVLDDTWNEIPEPRRENVLSRLRKMSESYSDLTRNAPPSYTDPIARFAYIYKYTTCHASIVAEKIAEVPALKHMFDSKAGQWVSVACVGGGPGSDFLGVLKYLMLEDHKGSLKCFLLDREPAWGDSWADVDQRTDTLDIRISTHCQVLDVTDPSTWKAQNRYLNADLFTFIYFVSEVYQKADKLDEYLDYVFEHAKSGAYFLFIDNDKPIFYDRFDNATRGHLVRVASGQGRYVIDMNEQKSDLEPHFSRLGHQPKLQTYIAWRVYKKP